jgi:hypothetical protein
MRPQGVGSYRGAVHPYFAEFMLDEYERKLQRALRRPRPERDASTRRSLPRFLRR